MFTETVGNNVELAVQSVLDGISVLATRSSVEDVMGSTIGAKGG